MITAVQGMPPMVVTGTDAAKSEAQQEANVQQRISSTATEAAASEARKSSTSQQNNTETSAINFSELNDKLQDFVNDNTFAKFSIDDATRRFVVQFIDKSTDEVVRQLPPEESLKIAQLIASQLDKMQGNLTDAKV